MNALMVHMRAQLRIIGLSLMNINTQNSVECRQQLRKCVSEVQVLIKINALLEEVWNKPTLIICMLNVSMLCTLVVIVPEVSIINIIFIRNKKTFMFQENDSLKLFGYFVFAFCGVYEPLISAWYSQCLQEEVNSKLYILQKYVAFIKWFCFSF